MQVCTGCTRVHRNLLLVWESPFYWLCNGHFPKKRSPQRLSLAIIPPFGGIPTKAACDASAEAKEGAHNVWREGRQCATEVPSAMDAEWWVMPATRDWE